MKVVAVIPARYASTRLECKLLLDLNGKSVLQRTYEQACKAKHLEKIIIATDDERILEHARSFGALAEMTSKDHKSGSDRIAELASKNQDWQIIVNVQGDEPMINPADIDKAIEPFLHDPHCQMTSLYHCISDTDEVNNPNNVKVITDANNMAMYFSRSVIPMDRSANKQLEYKKHIGLYAYRRETLLQIASFSQTELECSEKLEQLRALENGIQIKMLEVESAPIGIDTREDYDRALAQIIKS